MYIRELRKKCEIHWATLPSSKPTKQKQMLYRFDIVLATAHKGKIFADFGKKGIKKAMTGKDLGKMHSWVQN